MYWMVGVVRVVGVEAGYRYGGIDKMGEPFRYGKDAISGA